MCAKCWVPDFNPVLLCPSPPACPLLQQMYLYVPHHVPMDLYVPHHVPMALYVPHPWLLPMGSLAGDQKAGTARSLSISSRLPPYAAIASLAGVSPSMAQRPQGRSSSKPQPSLASGSPVPLPASSAPEDGIGCSQLQSLQVPLDPSLAPTTLPTPL